MTLTEFLLARIAEDEEAARAERADALVGFYWKGYPQKAYEELQGRVLATSSRTLAECEAKRRIVADHRADIGADPCDAHDASFRTIDCDTLRLLALPHVDHPDYREEWRP